MWTDWLPWRRRRALEGLEEEIREHLEHEIETNLARGMSPQEARRQALVRFGNVSLIREDTRAVWTWGALEQALQDLRFGARILKNAPGLSCTAAVLVALVIGINTTIFSMIDSLVTSPAAGVNPDGLVRIITNRPGIPSISYPDYLDYAAQTTTLQSLAAFTDSRVTLTSARGSYSVMAVGATPNYFETIGIRPVRGRVFSARESSYDDTSEFLAVLSYRAWQDYFDGDEGIVGRSITIDDQPATVIGVAPPDFRGTMQFEQADVWLPLAMLWQRLQPKNATQWLSDRSGARADVFGRLSAGSSISAAHADISTIQARLRLAYPGIDRAPVAVVQYAATAGGVVPFIAPTFLAIFSIVTLLTVLIVSANVANLMLARAATRQRETSVRQSLGASRGRIVRLLLAEGLSISFVACLAAVIMTVWAVRTIPRLLPSSPIGRLGLDFTPNWRIVVYALVLAGVGTLAFTLAPALRAWRQDPLPWLKAGEHSVAQGRSRLTSGLVVLQLAFSVVLLSIANLASRSASLMTVDLGFDTQNLLVLMVRTTGSATTREANLALIDRLQARLRNVPGVAEVSYVRNAPPSSWSSEMVQSGTSQPVRATAHVAGPGYFQVMGLSVKEGRVLTASDRDRLSPVAVVNQNLAETLWPGRSAMGRTMSLTRRSPGLTAAEQHGIDSTRLDGVEVVGVVPNAFVAGFNPERPDPRPNLVFISEQQSLASGRRDPGAPGEVVFYLRHEGGQLARIAATLGPALSEVDRRVAISVIRTMDEQLEGATFSARIIARLLTIFSAVSLLIAAIGQYAVIAFSMRRQVREFGLRIALGASARQVLGAVLGEGLVLTSAGLFIGLLLSLGVALAVRGVLFGVSPTDPQTYLQVFVMLMMVALVASALPARAATRVDPVKALRQE